MNRTNKVIALFIGNIVQKTISFIILILSARFFILNDYALIKQIDLFLSTFIPFFILGAPVTMTYLLAKYGVMNRQKSVVYITTFFLVISSLIFTALFVLLSNSFGSRYFSNYSQLLGLFIVVLFVGEVVTSFFNFFLIYLNRAIHSAFYSLFFVVVRLIVIIVAVCFQTGVIWLLTGYTILELLKISYVAVITYQIVKLKYNNFPAEIRKPLTTEFFSKVLSIGSAQIISSINNTFHRNYALQTFDARNYVAYTNATLEIPFINVVVTSQNDVLYPEYARLLSGMNYNVREALRIWRKSIRLSAYVLYPMMIVLFLFSQEIIELLFSDSYLYGAQLFAIYQVSMISKVAYPGTLYNASGHTTRYATINIFWVVIVVAFLLLFMSSVTTEQYAIYIAGTQISLFLLMAIDLSRLFKVKIGEILPINQLFIITTLSIGVIYLARVISTGYSLYLSLAIAATAFVFAGIINVIIIREELAYLIDIVIKLKDKYVAWKTKI